DRIGFGRDLHALVDPHRHRGEGALRFDGGDAADRHAEHRDLIALVDADGAGELPLNRVAVGPGPGLETGDDQHHREHGGQSAAQEFGLTHQFSPPCPSAPESRPSSPSMPAAGSSSIPASGPSGSSRSGMAGAPATIRSNPVPGSVFAARPSRTEVLTAAVL